MEEHGENKKMTYIDGEEHAKIATKGEIRVESTQPAGFKNEWPTQVVFSIFSDFDIIGAQKERV